LFIVVAGYPLATAPYGHGGWFDYVIGLLQYEPLIFPLALLGWGLSIGKGEYRPLHLLLILYFGFNVVAWRWGLFGTAGILRYFVPIVPWLAIYAATAFDCTKLLLAYQHLARYGLNPLGLQLLFTLLVLNSHTAGYHQYNTPTVHHALIEAGQWIQAQHPQDYVYSSHPALLYYAGRDFYSSAFVVDSKPLQRDGIVAFELGFGSSELLKYLKRSSLLIEFDNYVLIYDHKLTAVTAHPAMAFGVEDIKPYLRDGWSAPEGWGTWAEGTYSKLSLYLGKPQTMTLTITVIPHFVAGRQQSIKVYYNNTPVGHYEFPEGAQDPQQFSFQVPKSLISGQLDVIKFEYGYAVSPQELGASNDERQLAVGFIRARFSPLK
jgi:hypothetical protein